MARAFAGLIAALLLAAALGGGVLASDGDPKARGSAPRGKRLFQKHCTECHYATAERKIGPGLKGLYKKEKLDENDKPVNDANVREIIEEGAGAGEMPEFKDKLKPREIDDLLAYLRSL